MSNTVLLLCPAIFIDQYTAPFIFCKGNLNKVEIFYLMFQSGLPLRLTKTDI